MSGYVVAEISDTGKSNLNGIVEVGAGENKQQSGNKVHASVCQHYCTFE